MLLSISQFNIRFFSHQTIFYISTLITPLNNFDYSFDNLNYKDNQTNMCFLILGVKIFFLVVFLSCSLSTKPVSFLFRPLKTTVTVVPYRHCAALSSNGYSFNHCLCFEDTSKGSEGEKDDFSLLFNCNECDEC